MAEPKWEIIPTKTTRSNDESPAVPMPRIVVLYDDVDISVDLAPFLSSMTWTDNLDGQEADNLEIRLEDTDHRWINEWYPDPGAVLTAQIGYAGQTLVSCGQFEIDEIELMGGPSTVSIKAISAGITKALRTDRNIAYDQTTLKGLAEAVAARHGLSLTGTVEAIPIERATQHKESDIKFLQRVGSDYGYAFNIRHKQLVFYKKEDLKNVSTVRTFVEADFKPGWNLRDKVKGTPKSADVAYSDPKTKSTLAHSTDASSGAVAATSADSLKLKGRTENKAQAKAKAKAALDKAGDEATTGSMTLWGDPSLCAGINIALQGFGRFDGNYQISASRHTVTRSGGYETSIDIRRFKVSDSAKQQADKAKATPPKRGSKAGSSSANAQKSSKISYDPNKGGGTVPIPVNS